MKKRIFKIIKTIVFLGIILCIGVFFFIKNDWKNFTTKKEIAELIKDIKSSESLPEKFYDLYEIENPNAYQYNLNRSVISLLLNQKYVSPLSERVAVLSRIVTYNSSSFIRLKFRYITVTWLLEEKTTQKECFNWLVSKYDFLNNSKGLKQASKIYFNKELADLDEYELATFVIMSRNSSLYNPFRRKEKVHKEVPKLLVKYHNKSE